MAAAEEKKVVFEEEESDDCDDEPPPDFYKTNKPKPRGSVSAEAYGEWNKKVAFTAPVIPKTVEQTERLRGILVRSFMFSHLAAAEMDSVIGAMAEERWCPGQRIIQQGDAGECLYVVETGVLACSINDASGAEVVVKLCEASDVFGELALLYNCPRAASVICPADQTEACTWKLDRDTFNNIVKDGAQQKRARNEQFLATVPLLATMDPVGRGLIADVVRSEHWPDGEIICQQGDIGKRFYFVESGAAVATKDGEQVMEYGPSDYFGELALIRNQPRATTVLSKGDLWLLSLDGASVKRLLNVDGLEKAAEGKYS